MKTYLKLYLSLTIIFWFTLTSSSSDSFVIDQQGKDIVIIDEYLPEADVLIKSLKPEVKFIYLNQNSQMAPFISEVVRNNAPVKSLHIITHGNSGAIFTTATHLNTEILKDKKEEIKKWKDSFTSDGAILFYGCEVGKGEKGNEFVESLSFITGLNILASDNLTGSADKGGDWNLEVKTGLVNPGICFSSDIEKYGNILEKKILIWTGSSMSSYFDKPHQFINSQTNFKSVRITDDNTMPDLSSYSVVFLALPSSTITVAQISALKIFVESGGRILLCGENANFSSNNNIITAAVAKLGGHLSITSLYLDNGQYNRTTHINTASPLMEGVTYLTGGAASAINIGGDATVLLRSIDNPSKIIMAQEKIGSGDIIAWADVEQWLLGTIVTTDGFGKLLLNLINGAADRIQNNLIASIFTTEAHIINESTALTGGNITSENGSAITERGICLSAQNYNPSTADTVIIGSGTGKGLYSVTLTGLAMNKKYYVRAYAVNGNGTAYGNTVIFTTPSVVNYLPTAVADKFSCLRSGTINGNVMLNDWDKDGDAMTAKMITSPTYASGTFTLNANGTFSYTNNGNAGSSDFFSYYLTDGKSNSSTVGVSISVYTVSKLPTGANASAIVKRDKPYNFMASGFTFSDLDAGHTFNGIRIVTLPAKGILKYDGFPVVAESICNDVTRLTYEVNGDAGSDTPFTTFTFKVISSSAEESSSSYTMDINISTKQDAVVALSKLSQVYTGAPCPVTVTVVPEGLTVNVTYDGSATAPTALGTYAVVATVVDALYDGSTAGKLVISKPKVTATADNKSRDTYQVNPAFTITYSGFLNGHTEAVLDTKPVASTTAVYNSPDGTYPITLSEGKDDVYDIITVPGMLRVGKPVITVTADNKTKAYGDANPALTFTYSGFIDGDTESVIDTKPVAATTAKETSIPASYDITVSGGTDDKYKFAYVKGTLTITKAPLTATANDATRSKLQNNPVFTITYSGFKNSDTETVLNSKPVASTTANYYSEPGTYPITLSGGTDDVYEITRINGTLTINAKSILSVKAEDNTKAYGSVNPALTLTYSGFIDGDTETVLDTKPVAATEATASSITGVYDITVSGGLDDKYDFTYTSGTLTITKASLTITADSKSCVYEEPVPVLTLSYSGFVNGEDQNVLDTKPMATTSAIQYSDAGIYDIIASGGNDNNYSFIYVKGALNIAKADQEITFNEVPSTLRVTEQYELAATSSAGLPVTFSSSDPDIVSVTGNTITIKDNRQVNLIAKQAGDKNRNAAPDAIQSVAFLSSFDNSNALFTPNNDGVNDYWIIPDIAEMGVVKVKVYNRYGALVYESTNYTNNWEGTWKNLPLPSASYYYIIDSSTKGKLKGVVNIMR